MKKFELKEVGVRLRLIALLVIIVGAALFTADSSCARTESWSDAKQTTLASLAQELQAAVVYQRDGGIYLSEIGSTTARRIAAKGSYPRWSPDGQWIAFVRGNSIIRVPAAGGEAEKLASAETPRAVGYHPSGEEVLFTDGKSLKSVVIATREVRTIATGHKFLEVDISADGTRLITSVRVTGGTATRAYDLAARKSGKFANGCSASLSPDAAVVTNNSRSHRHLNLLSWDTGKKLGSLAAPNGTKLDNQFWSNHANWIAAISEGGNVYLYRVSNGRTYQVTTGGRADRPDLFVRTVLAGS